MTASLRSHIADVLLEAWLDKAKPGHIMWDGAADALLTDPTLAAIIDLAAWANERIVSFPEDSPEVRALLAAWRAKS